MEVMKMNQPNEGIKCEVDTCEYYMSGDYCSASKIEVQPKNKDTSSNEADCRTFKPSEKMY